MDNKRVDSIIFDLKQCIDDLAHELKILQEQYKLLDKKIRMIKVKKV